MMSEVDAAALEKIAPGARTAVVPNGADLSYFRPRRGEEGPALIYTGGMKMFANQDAVLFFVREIWPLVKREVPEAVFIAVGTNPPEELKAMAAAGSGIEVTGFIDDVRPYVARASVYVVPLRVGGGTRLKVLDAMAQGKAIVSTSIGCEGIDVVPGETLVIEDEPRAFAGQVVALLHDAGRRQRLGLAARALVERKYSWAVIGRSLQQAYEAAVRHNREKTTA
jgi:glycosyltransferase involved in cell wall biosynthesis